MHFRTGSSAVVGSAKTCREIVRTSFFTYLPCFLSTSPLTIRKFHLALQTISGEKRTSHCLARTKWPSNSRSWQVAVLAPLSRSLWCLLSLLRSSACLISSLHLIKSRQVLLPINRLQDKSSTYAGPMDVVRQTLRKNGVLGLYVGMESTFWRRVNFQLPAAGSDVDMASKTFLVERWILWLDLPSTGNDAQSWSTCLFPRAPTIGAYFISASRLSKASCWITSFREVSVVSLVPPWTRRKRPVTIPSSLTNIGSCLVSTCVFHREYQLCHGSNVRFRLWNPVFKGPRKFQASHPSTTGHSLRKLHVVSVPQSQPNIFVVTDWWQSSVKKVPPHSIKDSCPKFYDSLLEEESCYWSSNSH